MAAYRHVCEVIQEMRDFMACFCDTVSPADYYESDEAIMENARFTRRRGHIFAMIEEIQTHVNRMEAALRVQKEYFELKDEVHHLEEIIEILREEAGDIDEED